MFDPKLPQRPRCPPDQNGALSHKENLMKTHENETVDEMDTRHKAEKGTLWYLTPVLRQDNASCNDDAHQPLSIKITPKRI